MSSTSTYAHAMAIVLGSFLSGTMASLSMVAIPVFLDTTSQPMQLYREWERMYHYGHQVLPGMAVVTLIMYASAAMMERHAKRPWSPLLTAGLVTVTLIPFTWIFMIPTNNTLFRLEMESRSMGMIGSLAEAQALIRTWAWLHITRSAFPLVGALLGIRAMLSSSK